jgi:protein-tyrosine phosphatase
MMIKKMEEFVVSCTAFGNVWIGEHPRYDEQKLVDMGITHVVSVCEQPFEPTTKQLQGRVKHVKLTDGVSYSQVPLVKLFSQYVDWFRQHQQQYDSHKILVHCEYGISRSTSFVIFMMMKMAHMSYSTALLMLRTDHPCTRPDPAFARQLQEFGLSFGRRQDWFLQKQHRHRIPIYLQATLDWITKTKNNK